MRSKLSATLLVFAGLIGTGCATSYSGMPALEFNQLSYASTTGQAWPEKSLGLSETAARYGLRSVPAVHYVELNPGGAKTVLFVHGLGSYLKFWRYQLDAFAARGFRVVAVDMLGYGKSDKPASFPYTMEAMADVLRELVSALGLERPVIVGHSMGGQTALSLAIRYPEIPGALVLTSPAGFEDFSPAEERWLRSVFTVAFIQGAGEDAIWGSVRRSNFDRWTSEYEWLIEERVRLAKARDFDAYAYANVKSVAGLAATDFIRDNLSAIQVPTLIIHGDHDRLIPNPFMHGGEARDLMEWARDRIQGAALVTLEGCGHTVQIDCHDAYNAAVERFLGTVPADSAPAAGGSPSAALPDGDAE